MHAQTVAQELIQPEEKDTKIIRRKWASQENPAEDRIESSIMTATDTTFETNEPKVYTAGEQVSAAYESATESATQSSYELSTYEQDLDSSTPTSESVSVKSTQFIDESEASGEWCDADVNELRLISRQKRSLSTEENAEMCD
jgi:hypothetical protein